MKIPSIIKSFLSSLFQREIHNPSSTKKGEGRVFKGARILILTGLVLSPMAAIAADNTWTGSGPFATGLGNRVITALTVDPTNPLLIYAGTGSETVFQYQIVLPSVTTGAASAITTIGATLNATVNAHNADTLVTFEYGLDTGYGSTVAAAPGTVTGASETPVSAALGSLTPGLTYHYRAAGVSSAGTAYGSDTAFTTPKLDQAALTLNAGSPLTYNATETVSTTGGSGAGAVSYQVTAGSCSISGGNQLTATGGTGSCSITATKAADTNYNAATASGAVTLQKADQTTSVSPHAPAAAAYNSSFTVAATATSGLGVAIIASGSCSGSGTGSASVTMTSGAGDCTVHYNQAGDGNYNVAPEVTELTTAFYPDHVIIAAATGNGDITLDTNSLGCGFTAWDARTSAQVGKDPSYSYPYGLVEFTLNCASAGVTITFPGRISDMPYRKYGPTTPGNAATTAWYTFSNVTINSSTSITLHLQDGQLGDDTGVDGILVDPGGPGQPGESSAAAVPTMTEWGMIIFVILLGIGSTHYLWRRVTT